MHSSFLCQTEMKETPFLSLPSKNVMSHDRQVWNRTETEKARSRHLIFGSYSSQEPQFLCPDSLFSCGFDRLPNIFQTHLIQGVLLDILTKCHTEMISHLRAFCPLLLLPIPHCMDNHPLKQRSPALDWALRPETRLSHLCTLVLNTVPET